MAGSGLRGLVEDMSRREERERKHEQCLGRYKAAWMIVLFLLCLTGAFKYFEAQHKNEPDDFKLNLSTEILGVIASTGVTLFFLDKLNQRRDRENLKRRLIGEARSRSHDIAISAVEWMDREGWLRGEDGLLKGAELPGARLETARLSGANFVGSNLAHANLSGANLQDASLIGASLFMANLHGAVLKDADLRGAYLNDANLHRAGLPGANMENIIGIKIDLSMAGLMDVVLRDADIKLADLQGAQLWDTDFTGANLLGAKLANVEEAKRAIWERANLARVDLRKIDLEKANMKSAILRYADLRGTNLMGTDLENADLFGAYLQDARVKYWPTVKEDRAGDFADRIIVGIDDSEFPETNFLGTRLPDGTFFTEDSDIFDIDRFVNPSDPRFAQTLEIIERIRAY